MWLRDSRSRSPKCSQSLIIEMETNESQQLDENMEMLYSALLKLDVETENEGLLNWVKNVC